MLTARDILTLARTHPFYRTLLRDVHSLAECPILDKATLYRGIEDGLAQRRLRGGIYFSPSGGTTSGQSRYFPTDIQENHVQRALLATCLLQAGILGPDTVALNLFTSNRMFRSLEIFTEFCERCGATSLPVSEHADNRDVFQTIEQFEPDVIMGMPSRLVSLARTVERVSIPQVLFGGERLHHAKRRFLQQRLGAVRFSAIYGSAELGIVAWQADLNDPPVYRFPCRITDVEVVDTDGDGFGRLVLTNLVRTVYPVLRYDTGDVGRVRSRSDSEVLVELQGRTADSFDIGGNYHALADFEDILSDTLEFQIQIAFDPETQRDRIRFCLVGDAGLQTRENVIRERLESDDDSFKTEVVVGRPDHLIRTAGAKVPALIDMRGNAPC